MLVRMRCASARTANARPWARRNTSSSVFPALALLTSRYSRSKRDFSRAWIASAAIDTSDRGTLKLPVPSFRGSPSSSCERTAQRTSSGATSAMTRERVALRQPSQSVSFASTIRRIARANPIPLRFPTPTWPHDPADFVAIGAATSPSFSRDGTTLFHLRGSGLPQVWSLNLATGEDRQLTFHDEKVAILRRSPADDRLIYGIDRGGDERQQLMLLDR